MKSPEDLYDLLQQNGVAVYQGELGQIPAVTIEMGGEYAVFLNPDCLCNSAQESDILAHEIGHIMTGSTHPVDSPAYLVEQHEARAERCAIRLMIPWQHLKEAVAAGKSTPWDLAEYFNVSEDMIHKALSYYALRGYHLPSGQDGPQVS